VLTAEEIAKLRSNFNSIISDAGKKFEDLQKITDLSFNGANASQNTLQGAIRASLTEDTGQLLAGQFGGLRLTAVQQFNRLTDILGVANDIKYNTSFILSMDARLQRIEMFGIKIKG
jgi:hypothetical protein